MNSSLSGPSQWTRAQTAIAWVFVSFVGLLFSCCLLMSLPDILRDAQDYGGVVKPFILGWFTFAFALVSLDPPTVLFLLVSAVLAWLLFCGARWLVSRHMKNNPGTKSPRPMALLGLCWVISLVTLSLAGIAQSAIWFARESAPILRRQLKSFGSSNSLNYTANEVHATMYDPGQEPSTRPGCQYWNSRLPRQFEACDVGFITRPDGTLFAGYVVPRDETQRTIQGVAVILMIPDNPPYPRYDQSQNLQNGSQWPALLKTLQDQANQPSPESAK